MNLVKKDSTDITRYIKIINASTGQPETGITIADLDLQYTRNRSAPSAKVDATALATTSTAHTDNRAIEIDATFSPGLYRIDWPDAAFATGVDKVILCVSSTSIDPAFEEIQLVDNMPGEVNATGIADIAAAVWDEALAGHNTAGSTGEALTDAAAAGVLSAADIADAVWEEAISDHSGTVGSVAESLFITNDTVVDALDTTISSRAAEVTVAAVQAKTDSLTFSVAGQVDANIQYVNNTEVQGAGTSGNEWRPV